MLIINRPLGGRPIQRGRQALILVTADGASFSIPFGTHREVSRSVYFANKEKLDSLRAAGTIQIIGAPVVPEPADSPSPSEKEKPVEETPIETPAVEPEIVESEPASANVVDAEVIEDEPPSKKTTNAKGVGGRRRKKEV